MIRSILAAFVIAALAGRICAAQKDVPWSSYNGGREGDHYSRLTQINRANVNQLQVAWTFDTGEKGGMQDNPLIIGRTLYAYTPTEKIVALDAATGKLKWKFDSGVVGTQPARGMSWWTDGKENRLLVGIMNFLYCLDPATGKPIASFGEQGRIDLRKGLREPWEQQSIVLTTPGMLWKDMIIVGGRNPEAHPAPPGDVRAFDVHTGALRWVFHTIPHPGEAGYETWPADAWKRSGAANNWAGMALDEERGILYVPTGSAVMDFYGGDRIGDDLYANTLLALDANTGKRIWHFQDVHHDIWDRDFPSPPALFTIVRDGKTIPAMAQTTKQGWLYLFNRLTGEPLFPIHEHEYPASNVPGEQASKTQPLPDWPQPFARQRLTEADLTTRTPAAHEWAVKTFREFKSDGQFIPFSVERQTVIFPGFDGGAEWGGPAIDPVHKILYVNANEMVWTGGLAPAGKVSSPGEGIYRSQCAICHGLDRTGSPPAFPALLDAMPRLGEEKIRQTVRQGTGRMPSFPNLDGSGLTDLVAFLRTKPSAEDKKEMAAALGAETSTDAAGQATYQERCAICHGEKREGIPPSFPMLIGLGTRLSATQTVDLIHKGKGRMPPMPALQGAELESLLRYLGVGAKSSETQEAKNVPPDYIFSGYRKFLDPDGYPAFTPPWGTLNAIDLTTGKYLWKVNLGEYPALAKQGLANTGSENYGGPVVTAGGVLFISATVYDHTIRAFDTGTGKLLWRADLPFSGVATPATYMVDGRQYVVIATSNARTPNEPQGGIYVAFALPSHK
ncbi:c-type cytochrome [Terracidiphilus gabretensis]|uniref:c-type cytochrome n=1 Tax=Terracidiphilus gabretensis TaxID=1577687 RepID=UPI00071BCD31|nr:c-type cytochrome [Terracidiphilus gabretensis]